MGIFERNNRQFMFRLPIFARMLEEQYPVDFVFAKAQQELQSVPSPAVATLA
jgi:hypothetical protein